MARGAVISVRVVDRLSLVDDHVWRSGKVAGQYRSECAYMNCRRPASEHARAVDPSRARPGRRSP